MPAGKKCVVISWAVFALSVLVAAIFAAFLIRFNQLNGHSFLLGTGDQKPLLDGLTHGESFSSYYCKGLNVRATSHSGEASPAPVAINAYVLSKVPVPSGEPHRQVLKETVTIGATRVTPPMIFNLHRGTTREVSWLKIHACSASTIVVLYRCEDESAALAWERDGDNQRCAAVCEYARCGTSEGHFCSFVARSGRQVDEFVLMVATLVDTSDKSVHVQANVTRYPYDLAVHSFACLNQSECELPVVMNETQAVVLESPLARSNAIDPIVLKTECVPRLGVYFAFYLGAPLALIFVATLCVFLPCSLIQKSLTTQSIELRVKGLGGFHGDVVNHGIKVGDGAGLLDNQYLQEEEDDACNNDR